MNQRLGDFLLSQAVISKVDWQYLKELVVAYSPKYNSANDEILISISLKNFLPLKIFNLFHQYTQKNKINFYFSVQDQSLCTEKICKKYLSFLGEIILDSSDFLLVVRKLNFLFKNDSLIFVCENREQVNYLKPYQEKIKTFLNLSGFLFTKIVYELSEQFDSATNNLAKSSAEDLTLKTIKLSDSIIQGREYFFEGQIFKITMSKKMDRISSFLITDFDDSIQCVFKNADFALAKRDSLCVNDWVRVKCLIKKNVFFHNEIYGEIQQLEKIDPPARFQRIDDCAKKRTEIIMHTNLCAFDGLNSPAEIISCVKAWGWDSICITDLNCVQSFPEFSNIVDSNFKVIYGMEVNVIPEFVPIVVNPKTIDFTEDEYVVVDLETTGLIPLVDEVIEFAGVKYKNGKQIDELHFLVKTKSKISPEITKLTQITDEMVQNEGLSIVQALSKISEFIGESTIVAHNGICFDIPFLNNAFVNNGLPPLKNAVVDTLRLSWALNPESTLHNLGAVARRYKVNYDEMVAHRALVDAKFLCNIWDKVLSQLEELKIKNAVELNEKYADFRFQSVNRSFFPVFVYARNKSGLKTLYSLLSEMLTDKCAKNPRLPVEKLVKNRENLVIVNNPIEGDVINEILMGNCDRIKSLIEFYDFIAISPPETYSHKIQNGALKITDYQLIVKKIMEICKKLHKKCIASSDAYYLNPWQKKFHRVLVHTKAIGGKRHRFFDYQRKVQNLPDLYLHTTKDLLKSFSFLNNDKIVKKIVIDNSKYFVDFFDRIEPIVKEKCLFKGENTDEKLTELTWKNAKSFYGDNLPSVVKERIEHELNSIIKNGYSIIYWISQLLVKKSHQDGFLVGSRGSVGSSLVAMLLHISEINPLPSHYFCHKCHYIEFTPHVEDGYDLPGKKCPNCIDAVIFGDGHDIPFETFMGLHGEKVPDIDLNFSGLYQAKAHEFIRDLFGKEHTLRAGTVTTIAEKTAFGFVKTYLEETNFVSVREAEIYCHVSNIIGVKRSTGQHPGGIIIFPKDTSILDFTPYNYPADDFSSSWYTTHFAFEYLHDTVLKLDILGHDDPTVLRKLHELTNKDPKTVPNYDPNVLSLFSNLTSLKLSPKDICDETTGVIGISEFGTNFVRQILKTIKPKSFADLVRISGLSHGTNVWRNNAEKLIKEGKFKIQFSDVIACRDDIMIYLSKRGLSQEDAFWIMEDVRKGSSLSEKHIKLMCEHGVPDWYVDSCKKIKYLFPKAHAVAYVLMAWRIAWFKLYYPLAYYATHFTYKIVEHDVPTIVGGKAEVERKLMNLYQSGNQFKYKLLKPKEIELINTYETAIEMLSRGIKMQPISLTKSSADEYLVDKESHSLIPPFITIPGLGGIVANSIVRARSLCEFKSVEDFKKRTKVTNTHLKNLTKLGVLSQLRTKNMRTLFD